MLADGSIEFEGRPTRPEPGVSIFFEDVAIQSAAGVRPQMTASVFSGCLLIQCILPVTRVRVVLLPSAAQ